MKRKKEIEIMKPIFKIFLYRVDLKFSVFIEGKVQKNPSDAVDSILGRFGFIEGKIQNPSRTGIRLQKGFSRCFLLSLILLFSGGSAFAVKKYKSKDQTGAIEEKNKDMLIAQQQKSQNPAIEENNKGMLIAQQQKSQNPAIEENNKDTLTVKQQKEQTGATEGTNKQALTSTQQKAQTGATEGTNKQALTVKQQKAQTGATEGTNKQALTTKQQEETKRRRSLKKEGERASYAFRPLLIQGKKRLIQKTKDMKVDSGNIAESELFFIDIDFKKRIFEHEGQR